MNDHSKLIAMLYTLNKTFPEEIKKINPEYLTTYELKEKYSNLLENIIKGVRNEIKLISEKEMIPEPSYTEFCYFKLLGTLKESKPFYLPFNGAVETVSLDESDYKCPFCGEIFNEDTIDDHIKQEVNK
ncbi:hypothetical protein TCON_0768 [Astathelohania contejeani]|uniref:C2H2-type domain-containing protein n=1 Tax=Astathelohania contejeani TaxID=164912 RepID=A0ABQ7I0N4_9MICR|nr:hypothetical protein TCON_0768 [Thelohania contejeani]